MGRHKGQAPAPPANNSSMDEESLSLVAAFDDIVRSEKVLCDSSDEQFLLFLGNQELCRKRWKAAEEECQRLQVELSTSEQNIRSMELRLNQARDLLSTEVSLRKKTELERDSLLERWELVRDLISGESGATFNDETRQKLRQLESSINSVTGRKVNGVFSPGNNHLSVVNEIDSTGSILDASDLSLDGTCDPTGDESRLRSGRAYKRRSSSHGGRQQQEQSKRSRSRSAGRAERPQPPPRKSLEKLANRRSSRRYVKEMKEMYRERNIDDYLPSAPPCEGPDCWQAAHAMSPTAPSTPYSPTKPVARAYSNAGLLRSRKHVFSQKTVYRSERCGPCGLKIKFGKYCLKCRDCKSVCHPLCRDKVPLPCVAVGVGTPTRTQRAIIADFTPLTTPMVPALIVHCVNEVERRGLGEIGLYRVPGSEREVKELKEKFLRGKGCPSLTDLDVHVVCGCIKDFLRSLREPLIPASMWSTFVNAACNPDMTDGESPLIQALNELPQPNRDTLAFLVLHLQKVAACPECKMPTSNLAKILGPTVVGYSTLDPEPKVILEDTEKQSITMEKLLSINSDVLSSYVNVESDFLHVNQQVHTPFKTESPDLGQSPLTQGRYRLSSFSGKNHFASPLLK